MIPSISFSIHALLRTFIATAVDSRMDLGPRFGEKF